MKIYAIYDNEQNNSKLIGFLFCYEKAGEYIIELQDDLNEWDAPLLFQKYVREGVFTIPKESAVLWVKERVIPSGRQNIGVILKNANMKEYNEISFLAITKGRCAQDNCYLEEVLPGDIPENIKARSKQNVSECFLSDNASVVCLFRDNAVSKVSLDKLAEDVEELKYVLKNDALLQSVRVDVGGYGISFNDTIGIPVKLLRDTRYEMPLLANDFHNFACNNIVDTTKACILIECSRQNIDYLVRADKLSPIITGTKEKMFTLGDVARVMDN